MISFLQLSLATILVACSGGGEASVPPELIVSKETLAFDKNAETQTLAVKCNVSWIVTSSADWCAVSVKRGDAGTTQFDVSVTVNAATVARNAIITVTADDAVKTVQVLQAAADVLTASDKNLEATADGGALTIEINASAKPKITSDSYWIDCAYIDNSLTINVSANPSIFARTGIITLTLADITETVEIIQAPLPLNVAPDNSGMAGAAQDIVRQMQYGWNIGNTLEATASATADPATGETSWGNPRVSQTLISAVKAAGFNAVRIPCAWNQYVTDETTCRINPQWLDRVKQVVDYCINEQMFVVLNIHWDGGWLEEHPFYASQQAVNARQQSLWTQIAACFRNYDEHLLFAGTNEVHADYGTPTAEHIAVQQSYLQTFVNAVRATGGRNAVRNLVVQSYNTNIDLAVQYPLLPADVATNRLIMEIHYYDPYDFTLESGANAKYFWGEARKGEPKAASWGLEEYADSQFAKIKATFGDKGIPVILGEYAATHRTSLTGVALAAHEESRAYYMRYITAKARENGVAPFVWDIGGDGKNGFRIFNRSTGVIEDAIILKSILNQ